MIEWLGAITGIAGAVLVALNVSWSKWGFILFLVSNLLIGGWAVANGADGVLAMQIAYAIINLIGIGRWFTGNSNRQTEGRWCECGRTWAYWTRSTGPR